MKRFFALAALLLGLAACQTEPEGLDVNVGGAVDTTITVAIPEGTRASSADGFDLSTLGTDYSLRYILEIYRVDDSNGTCQRHVLVSDNKSVAFPVRLVPGYNYNVVVWADIVEGNSEADRYYKTTDGLDAITIIENNEIKWNAMDETRDAYTATATFNNFQVSQLNTPISLTRPFAKLRVVATDIEDIRKVGLEPTTATVVYSQDMYRTFDARTGVASGSASKNHTITYPATPVYEDADGEYTLFADYFFVPSTGTAKFTLTVNAAAGVIKENDFNTDIFVQRNKLTTIKGDVLTVGGNVEVKVENDLGQLETINYADNAETLQEIINNADNNEETNITLGGDIDLGDLFGASILSTRATATLPIVIAEGKVVVLDLNGYKITTPYAEGSTTNHLYAFENHGSLTIQDSKGNGQIIARGIFNYGTMTLKSGTINACDGNGGYGVRNYDGAMFIMDGGSIVTSNEDGDAPTEGYDATTLRVDEGATATINGGVVNNVSNYTFAIDNHGEFTVNGGIFTSIHSTVSSYGTMTINGGTFTCDGLEGITAHALVAWDGSETTINGGIFDGKDNYNGFNVDADEGAIVNINGGEFLPVHSGSLYGDGTINVKGGTFFDDPSLRVVKGYVAEKNGDVFEVSQIALEAKFADNSWDKIILACQNDIVPETWAVGDKKEMTIDGKTYEIAIIGKNHDTYTGGDTKAPLTFQLFQLYGTAAKMNETQDNTTGWSGSKMRNTTMADILNDMPDAVKNAIKAVDKVSLNGSKSALETTSDKLFLLSEIEVNGSTYYSGGYVEGSRYAYYADQIMDSKGNIISQIMKPNGFIVSWYLRTPKNDKDDDTRFVAINGSGYMTHITAEIASGVVFGFCF